MIAIKRIRAARELTADYKLEVAEAQAKELWIDMQLNQYKEKRMKVRSNRKHSAYTVLINRKLKEKLFLQQKVETYHDLLNGLQYRFNDDI